MAVKAKPHRAPKKSKGLFGKKEPQRSKRAGDFFAKHKKSPQANEACGDVVAGTGFEPRDLRVMSPTSYQTAPPRDIFTENYSDLYILAHIIS